MQQPAVVSNLFYQTRYILGHPISSSEIIITLLKQENLSYKLTYENCLVFAPPKIIGSCPLKLCNCAVFINVQTWSIRRHAKGKYHA